MCVFGVQEDGDIGWCFEANASSSVSGGQASGGKASCWIGANGVVSV